MAYFYVKSGGTATGDAGRYASQQTGSFATMGASGYYDNIEECTTVATTTAGHGDFICISDASNASPYTANATLANFTATDNDPLVIISVSDTAMDTYSAGASEASSDNIDISFSAPVSIYGVSFSVGDDIRFTDFDAEVVLSDLTLTAQDSGDYPCYMVGKSSGFKLNNVTISYQGGLGIFYMGAEQNTIEAVNCTTTGLAAINVYNGNQNGGIVRMIGCDFSNAAHTNVVSADTWDQVSDNPAEITVQNCKLHADTSPTDTLPMGTRSFLLMTNSAATSEAAEYQYFYASHASQVEDETPIYRDNSTAFPSGTKTSLKCVTGAAVTPQRVFNFPYPTRYAELSNTASDTIRLYFMSATSLDDGDVFAEVVYQDGTNNHQPNNVMSATDGLVPDSFRTAGSLATNTEAWTGRTTENRYHIDLDTSTDAGADCVPIIRVYVAKALTTIYFCTSVDVL